MEVKVRAPKMNNREIVVEADVPETLAELTSEYGEEIVTSAALANIKIGLQNYVRTMLEDGKTDDEIQDAVAGWNPSVKAERGVSSLINKVSKMSDDEKAAIRAKLAELGI